MITSHLLGLCLTFNCLAYRKQLNIFFYTVAALNKQGISVPVGTESAAVI
jgi:hypothetical protein